MEVAYTLKRKLGSKITKTKGKRTNNEDFYEDRNNEED